MHLQIKIAHCTALKNEKIEDAVTLGSQSYES